MIILGEATPYQMAVEYINLGLAIFPIQYKGKIPLTRNGCKDATTDAAIVKGWWQRWPNANIGIATGSKSGGLVVIDLDTDEDRGIDGYLTLKNWEKEHGILPDSWRSITGRGGNHIFYKTNRDVRNSGGLLEGIDIRGEGGYIVAPPSVHKNGNKYEWEYAPDEFDLVEADETVYKLLDTKKHEKSNEFKVPDIIPDGQRNDTMYRYACALQSKALSDEAIIAAMKIENDLKCNPPLAEDELMKLIESALSLPKGVKANKNQIKPVTDNLPKNTYEVSVALIKNDKTGAVIQSIENICFVFRNDPELRGKIRYNVLSYSPFVYGSLPWDRQDNYREWNNTDDSNLKCYMESAYGLKVESKIMDALNIIVNENKFNPVIDHLERLKWDGKPYIKNLLPDYLGVENTRYTEETIKLFMLGAINRAYRPGCKFDYMPVLVGEQGCGKSTFFKILAGNDDWFNDNFNTVDGDKATEKLRGMWIVELAELLAVKKAQAVESIKAFITSTVDTYRPPYGRRTEQRPRVCVFAGTTNSTHFLTDRTGNRRYLPLLVRKGHIKKSMFDNKEEVIYEFQQAWAEALHIFKTDNPKLVFPKDLEEEIKEIQANYIEEDVRVGIIQEWLDSTSCEYVCIAQIYEKALKNEFNKPDRRTSTELHDIMQHFIKGWVPASTGSGKRHIKGYGSQLCYERAKKKTGSDFMDIKEDSSLPFM